MEEFYTQNGYEGVNYDASLSVKDIAKRLRDFIKRDKELSKCKWSVTCEHHTAITVCLMSSEVKVPFTKEWADKHPYEVENGYTQHADCEGVLVPELSKLVAKISDFLTSYTRDDSDGQIDYFDRNFYSHIYLGKWDTPYSVMEFKKPEKPVKKSAPKVDTSSSTLSYVDYSEKAFAIIGDTKPVKDTLKELGGRFNPRLTCGAGWIFSKKNEKEVRKALSIN